MRGTLKTLSKFSEHAIERDWLSLRNFTAIKPYIGNLQKLAQDYRDRAFEHMLWEVVGREATLSGRILRNREWCCVLAASFYGAEAPSSIPHLPGTKVTGPDFRVCFSDIPYEYHNQYLEGKFCDYER